MKRSVIFASMAIAAGLMLANTYTSIVDVPAWGRDIPSSIETSRQYYQATNPGNFFRIFSPMNQFLGLLCIIFFWSRSRQTRYFLIAAFVLYVIAEGMTFQYFYPRNEILFKTGSNAEVLKQAISQWSSMNWVRTLVILAGFICSSFALHHSYTTASQPAMARKRSFNEAAMATALS